MVPETRPPQIQEHMEVIGSDGVHVGTVDRVEGDHIKLTKQDAGDRKHHHVAMQYVGDVDGNRVRLTKPASEITSAFADQ